MSYAKTTATTKIANLNKRIRIVQGGTSAGKTIAILQYFMVASASDKKPTISSVVSESIPHLKRGAMRDFKNIMQQHNHWKEKSWRVQESTYTFDTGSTMEFFSADAGDKLRGARRQRLFINECNNVSFEAFEQLEVRTKDVVFLDYNPTAEFWVYDQLIHNPDRNQDVEHIILNYKDNEALDQEIVDSIETRRNRKGWWKVYGMGELGEVEGKIYKDWTIVDEIHKHARLERIGMDFGYSNDPTSIVAIYYINGAYILDEMVFMKGLSNKKIADIILNEGMEKTLCIADSAEPKSIDEIRSYGVNILPAEKGKDSVCNGIQLVQDQKIEVTKRSVNIIKEYRNYLWETDKDGIILNVPEHRFSHSMDAIRYGMSSLIKQPTVVAKASAPLPNYYDELGL